MSQLPFDALTDFFENPNDNNHYFYSQRKKTGGQPSSRFAVFNVESHDFYGVSLLTAALADIQLNGQELLDLSFQEGETTRLYFVVGNLQDGWAVRAVIEQGEYNDEGYYGDSYFTIAEVNADTLPDFIETTTAQFTNHCIQKTTETLSSLDQLPAASKTHVFNQVWEALEKNSETQSFVEYIKARLAQ